MATAKMAPKKAVSKGGAKEFADLVDKDSKVRAEVKKAASSILDVAKKHGFHIKGEDMQEHLRKKFGVPKRDPKIRTQMRQ